MLDLQAIGIGCVTLAGATRVKPQKFGKSVRKSENENMMKPWWKLKGLNKSTTTAYTARDFFHIFLYLNNIHSLKYSINLDI